ncbi:MAG: serine hydrolase [Ignavibacteriales bacterium]|nr:serine hydrolase [Ignavibacteriales bacterium]
MLTTNSKKLTLIILLIFSAVFCSSLTAQVDEKNISTQTDLLLNDAIEKGIFSGTVIISNNGRQFYKRQYGYSDWNTKRQIDDNTLFNIGSLNKQFTAEMIHQLVKEKKIDYENSLSRYLDLFPPEIGNKITIQHLLEMRSGLGDYIGNPAFQKIQQTDFKLRDILDIIKTEPLLFEPGTDRRYSNSGYVVLGAVIEKITGKSYEENLRSRIVEPLGLKNIYYTKSQKAERPERAFGATINFEGTKNSMDDISNSAPDGGIYTDAHDLFTFTETKRKNQLPSGKKSEEGFFAGGTQRWNSVIYYDKNGIAFIIMTNVAGIADELGKRIKSIIDGKTFQTLSLPVEMNLYKILTEKGIDCIENNIHEICRETGFPFDDRFLNFFGYRFLESNQIGAAIQLFALNVKLFPNNANCYDSLAETYLKKGDRKNAKKYYEKVLELEPENKRVRQIINEMKTHN